MWIVKAGTNHALRADEIGRANGSLPTHGIIATAEGEQQQLPDQTAGTRKFPAGHRFRIVLERLQSVKGKMAQAITGILQPHAAAFPVDETLVNKAAGHHK